MKLELMGVKNEIEVYEYDTPLQLAYKFCRENKWDLVKLILIKKINIKFYI